MAIVIPSKNIYQKENPKVRDNVIERIEVNAVEVVPDNEYETPVYNQEIIFDSSKSQEQTQNDKNLSYVTMDGGTYDNSNYTPYGEAIVYNSITGIYLNGSIEIAKSNYNKKIVKIFSDENLPIKKTAKCIIHNGTCKYIADIQRNPFDFTSITNIELVERNINNLYTSEILPDEIISETEANIYQEYKNSMGILTVIDKTAYNKLVYNDVLSNLSNILITETENSFVFDYIVLCGAYIDGCSSTKFIENLTYQKTTINLNGDSKYYEPSTIELTVYGNTIGIDLQDKTVYINGETQKKVHSFDGNELMQTTNYIKDTGEPAIVKMYGDTQLAYSRGKETATIRCSISDYYDYDTDEKLISVDKSTGKMSFKLYDQVIPMVYTNNGDKPMSLYKDGTPKIFQVLGSKIYYDGAVWQELSLQEI